MTTKRIVYSLNGKVEFVIPAPEFIAQLMAAGFTENQAIAFIQNKDVPAEATDVLIVDADQLPSRDKRSEWRIERGAVNAPTD